MSPWHFVYLSMPYNQFYAFHVMSYMYDRSNSCIRFVAMFLGPSLCYAMYGKSWIVKTKLPVFK